MQLQGNQRIFSLVFKPELSEFCFKTPTEQRIGFSIFHHMNRRRLKFCIYSEHCSNKFTSAN